MSTLSHALEGANTSFVMLLLPKFNVDQLYLPENHNKKHHLKTPLLDICTCLLGPYNSQVWNQTRSIDRWMDKQNGVYIRSRMLFSHKNPWSLSLAATWVELEDIMVSEIIQKQEDKYYFHFYVGAKMLTS
jgi:hypothetical protein